MYVVYWSEVEGDTLLPKVETFTKDQLKETLVFMEEKRKIERETHTVAFIAMVSQNPNSVGHPGVDVTGPDYNWRKRRP